MSRFLMGRIAAVSAAIFSCALLLALGRAQFDVDHEARGANELARTFGHLSALQDDPPEAIDGHIAAIREIVESGRMRHLELKLTDASGQELVTPPKPEQPSLVARVFVALLALERSPATTDATTWEIRRGDGRVYFATFLQNPVSEQDEALEDTLGLLGVLFGYGVLTLLAVYWALQRALTPLQPIHAAIEHYQRTDYAWRVPPLPMRELDAVGRSLNHMAGALAHAQDVRRTLSLKLLTLQEDERTRIARELHDEFGQVLTAMRADAAWLIRQTAEQPEVQAVVRELAAHCERIHGDVRDLLHQLRPQDPRVEGGAVPLQRLLDDLLQSWRDRPGQETRLSLHLDPAATRIGDEFALTLYRMTQEALTNAMRHACATRVDVAIRIDAHGALEWRVEDDGIGIDVADSAIHRGNGLAGISERVWAHHGEIGIVAVAPGTSNPGVRLVARFADVERAFQ